MDKLSEAFQKGFQKEAGISLLDDVVRGASSLGDDFLKGGWRNGR